MDAEEGVLAQPLSRILVNTAAAVRQIAEELPDAARRGPHDVAAVIMHEGRRAYVGIALAAVALILLLFGF